MTGVKEDSPAAEKGIQEGDVITKVVRNQQLQPVGGVQALKDVASKSNELAIFVETRGRGGHLIALSKSPK